MKYLLLLVVLLTSSVVHADTVDVFHFYLNDKLIHEQNYLARNKNVTIALSPFSRKDIFKVGYFTDTPSDRKTTLRLIAGGKLLNEFTYRVKSGLLPFPASDIANYLENAGAAGKVQLLMAVQRFDDTSPPTSFDTLASLVVKR